MATSHGVTGFCYWHYWFAGHRLLQRPLDEVLASGSPDFPFCVAWANQSWSGIWHGAPNKVLIEQTYPGVADDLDHFEYLRRAFEDPRYITVAGRPVLFVYQPAGLPEPARFVERWQKMAHDAGLGGLYLVASLGESDYRSHVEDGFDAAVHYAFPFQRTLGARVREHLFAKGISPGPRHYPYPDAPLDPPALGGRIFPSVYPNWDNTPRLGRRGVVATGATPERFATHVRRAIELGSHQPPRRADRGHQVVERVGRGQLPRARPGVRQGTTGGAGPRAPEGTRSGQLIISRAGQPQFRAIGGRCPRSRDWHGRRRTGRCLPSPVVPGGSEARDWH